MADLLSPFAIVYVTTNMSFASLEKYYYRVLAFFSIKIHAEIVE